VISVKSITVVSEDRVSLLADISYVLGKSNININSLNVEIVGGKAVISLMVRDPKRAKEVLESNGYNTTELDAIVIKVKNHIGEMASVTDRLSKAKVNIQNLALISSSSSEGVFAIRVDKPRKAMKLLGEMALVNGDGGYV
jgi:hypothetical protein